MEEIQVEIRSAVKQDVPTILRFISELAAYEHLEEEVVATEALLQEWIL